MLRALLLLLALAASSGFAGGPPVRATHVALYAQFDQTPPAAVVDALRSELDSIMGPIGLDFEWRLVAENRGTESTANLAVVTFKGRCDVDSLPLRSSNPGALGWTHISDGVIIPFTDLDCGGLRVFLGQELLALRREDREAALGRALGRVLAHELYHIFANTKEHAADGVGKPEYSVTDLLCSRFHFGTREVRELQMR